MINRYSRQIMRDVWSDQSKYAIWFEIEMLAHEAMESIGLIEKGLTKKIRDKLKDIIFDEARISEIESKTHHDVIAFLTFISEKIGEKQARYLHQGMTSSDILDTCLCIQLKKASQHIREDLDALLKELLKKAEEYKYLPTIGRSHGIHAEPTTVGLKFAQAYAEFDRALKRMEIAEKEISICALSGSVGTFANIDPRIGPIHGVHPKAKVSPNKNGGKKPPRSLISILSLSSFCKKAILNSPMKCRPNNIISTPDPILNSF